MTERKAKHSEADTGRELSPPAPVAALTGAPPPIEPEEEAPPASDPLAVLDAKLEIPAPTDAAAAVRALQGPPVASGEVQGRRGAGRPPGSRNKRSHHQAVRQAPTPAPGRVAGERPAGQFRSKVELESELAAARAQLALLQTDQKSLEEARRLVEGVVEILNIAAKTGHAPELLTDASEKRALADAFDEPLAPLMAKMGQYSPWAVGALTGLAIFAPKWVAFVDRKTLEQQQGIHTLVEVRTPAPPRDTPPSVDGPVAEVHRHDGAGPVLVPM